jgi:hypothetical protein
MEAVLFCLRCQKESQAKLPEFFYSICGSSCLEAPQTRTTRSEEALSMFAAMMDDSWVFIDNISLSGHLEGLGKDVLWLIVSKLHAKDITSLKCVSSFFRQIITKWQLEGLVKEQCQICKIFHEGPIRLHPGTFAGASYSDIIHSRQQKLFVVEGMDVARGAFHALVSNGSGILVGGAGAVMGGLLMPFLLTYGVFDYISSERNNRVALRSFGPGLAAPIVCGFFGYCKIVGTDGVIGFIEPVIAPPQYTRWKCCGKMGSNAEGCEVCDSCTSGFQKINI